MKIGVWVVVALVAALAYWQLQVKPEAERREANRILRAEQRAAAKADWVGVNGEKDISSTEKITRVTFKSSFGEFLDTHCYIYRNTEFRTAQFVCPGETAK